MNYDTVSLGDVCEFLDNQRVPITESDRKPGPYPYYGANGQQDSIDNYIFDEPLVLLAEDGGYFGSKDRPIAYKVTGKCWVNNHAHVLRPKSNIDVDYLHRVLSYYDVTKYVNGTTRQKLTKGNAENISFPLPPLTEQKRIASLLARADRLRQLRRTAHDLGDALLQSVFLEMFEKERRKIKIVKLGNLADVKTGGTPSREVSEYFDGQIPWVKTTEVVNEVIYETSEKISEAGLKASNCEIFPVGTILVAMYGQGLTRGRTAKLGIPATTNQACAAILPTTKINTSYLWTYLKISYNEIRDLGRGGNQPNMNLSMVRDLEIPVPPLSLQEEFAGVVARVESLRGRMGESTRQVEGLFESLLAQSFDGGR